MEVEERTSASNMTIEELVQQTGLSRFSLHVYAAIVNKQRPLRISNIGHIVCPNRIAIRSLCKEEIRRIEQEQLQQQQPQQTKPTPKATVLNVVSDDEEEVASDVTHVVPAPRKPVRKSDDELRKRIVWAREEELRKGQVKVAGTVNTRKPMDLEQKDLRLMFEYVGWAETVPEQGHESGENTTFFVFVYYVGPVDKGKNQEALSVAENWQIVPESHLDIFHKRIGSNYQSFLRQTPFTDVKECINENKHIEYDVRYILHKWRKSTTSVIKDKLLLVNRHLGLFEPVVAQEGSRAKPRTKKTRTEADRFAALPDPLPPLKALQPRPSYRIRTAKYTRITIDEYQRISRAPLGEQIQFSIEDLSRLVENMIVIQERQPSGYRWEPIVILKAWMMVSSISRYCQELMERVIRRHNLFFENTNYDSLLASINGNEEACSEIKTAFDAFTWAYVLFSLLCRPDALPVEIENKLIPPVNANKA